MASLCPFLVYSERQLCRRRAATGARSRPGLGLAVADIVVVVFLPQISKAFEIMTRKRISNSVVGRGYADSRDGDVEQHRNEGESLQKGDCWTTDGSFIDNFNDCFVIIVNE